MSGWYVDFYGGDNLIYALISTVEEALEMIGIIVFVYALLDYTSSSVKVVRVLVQGK